MNISSVLKDQVNCMVKSKVPLKFTLAMQMFFENGFDLYGGDHDIEYGRWCTLRHNKTKVVVKLSSNTFFGCSVELVSDETGIIN